VPLYQAQSDELDPRLHGDDGLRRDDGLFAFIVIPVFLPSFPRFYRHARVLTVIPAEAGIQGI